MHLADGVLQSPTLIVALNAVGIGAAVIAVRRRSASQPSTLWTGTLAAFVLAAQAINVPLAPGASAHAIGAGLLAMTLGPAQAILAMSAVLGVQALVLADGGLSVLGINVLNIAVIPVLAVHFAARAFGGKRPWIAAAIGTALGNVLGAVALAAMLVIGAGASAAVAFGWLVGVQTVAGVIEGVLTALVVRELVQRAPALLTARARVAPAGETPVSPRQGLAWAAVGVGVLVALLPFASDAPDALARAIEHVRPAP